jgi:ubiquinone/menaquinone biosynthesis C-methylase UbiE
MVNKTSFIIFLIFLGSISIAVSSIEYHSEHEKTSMLIDSYNQSGNSLERYLSYRDIPLFLKNYVQGFKALDFGAGTGISAQFLLDNSFDVSAVDISGEMLKQFVINHPTVPAYLIKENEFPFTQNSFDLVFSSFVVLELSSKEVIKEYFKTAYRVLKKDGIFITVTTSDIAYTKDWFLFDINYPENSNLKSGDFAKIHLRDKNITFIDYFWTENDIKNLLEETGFEVLEIHHPLGKSDEPYAWQDEKYYSPFAIFVAKSISIL